MEIRDKVCLVTGAGTGIGRGIAVELARRGARVVVNYPSETTGPEETIAEIAGFGGRALPVRADICALTAARAMIRQGGGGRIINISSIHGQQSLPRHAPYSLSKGGLDTMTRQLAIDLAPYHINVNTVAPGFIEVERTIRAERHYDREEMGKRIPAGRVGLPTDIASLVCYLASEEAGFITGQVILCDGGSSVWMSFSGQHF